MHVLRRGGVVFAATQALGWGLFSSALLCLMVLVISAARGMAYCIRCWIFATGSVMLASQLVSIRQDCACSPCTSEVCCCALMLIGSSACSAAWLHPLQAICHWGCVMLASEKGLLMLMITARTRLHQ